MHSPLCCRIRENSTTSIFYELSSEYVSFVFAFPPSLFFLPQISTCIVQSECMPPYFFNATPAIMDFKFGALFNRWGCAIVYTREKSSSNACVSLFVDSFEKWVDANQFVFSQTQKCLLCVASSSTKARKTRKVSSMEGSLSGVSSCSCNWNIGL